MINVAPMFSGASLLLLLVGGTLSASPSSDIWTARKAKASQYHTQDPASGTYQYGYTGPHHAKSESSFNGVTRGGYSFIDANGLMQTVSYTADAENGFRVHASNLPDQNLLSPVQDTPEVALAKKRHIEQLRRAESLTWQQPESEQQQYQQLQQQQQPQIRYVDFPNSRKNPYLLSPDEASNIPAPRQSNAIDSSLNKSVNMPQPRGFSTSSTSIHHHGYLVPAAPAVYAAVPLPLIQSSMRHSQDSLGQYEYSYTGDTSAKTESRTLDGTTRGAYSYIDANGLLQQVHYIADRDGFRVLATNLP